MVVFRKLFSILALILLIQLFPAKSQILINEYSASNLNTVQDNYNEFEDWIELYNAGTTGVNLGGYYLGDDTASVFRWVFPADLFLPSHGHLKIWASGRDEVSGSNYHTNFRLTQTRPDADWIVLSDPGGVILDKVHLQITQMDHSRGRTVSGGSEWSIFTTPTPGSSNGSSNAYARYAEKPMVSDTGGFYNTGQSITITTNEPNCKIRYTLDGTEPFSYSTQYTNPVNIFSTKVLKARVFSNDPSILPSLIEFNTYLINENHNLPVVSIAGNDLTELLNGNSALRPRGSIEFFNKFKVRATTAYGEFNEHGQDSWVHDQRSIDYITRDENGYNYALHQKFFALSDRDEFQRVILRAAGDDNYPGIDTSAHMRDDFVQTLSQKSGQQLDWRKSERIVIYANGAYWGIYAIREKVHDHDYTGYYYDQGKYDIQFIMLWGGTWAEYGGQQALDDWYELHDFILGHDMSNPFIYQAVAAQYDVTSLVDYIIINSYVVCSDWLNWNVGWWRGQNPDGSHKKWAYILWDEDATFGHYINYTGIPAQSPYVSPCFPEDITDPWQDPEGHIAVLNKLRENAEFDQYYISRYIDLLNTTFNNDYMINLLDSMAAIISSEMPQHTQRWGGSFSQWQSNVQRIRNFITARNSIMDGGLKQCYDLTGPYDVVISAEPEGVGLVKINSLELSQFPWDGEYFGGIDVKLSAIETNPYYEFDRWVLKNHQVTPSDTLLDVILNLTMGDSILALFRPRVFEDSLVINEINYNSDGSFDPGDWVEFYNPHPYEMDISGWIFKDEDDLHEFEFPDGTIISAEGYLVLAADTAAFDSLFPDVDNYTGPMGFGLSGNGELIRLYDDDNTIIDTVLYDDNDPWPTEPDGNGPTLELINYTWDNALAESWAASALNGTPGEENGNFVKVPEPAIAPAQQVSCQVLPNPFRSSAIFRIKADKVMENASIEIFNLFGQEVKHISSINTNYIPLFGDELVPGIYIYRLKDDKGMVMFTGKFVVN
ncbi:MAG: T9SS type A sorting domain-containing protein [Bacteroidales bacterium]|nr:T9SS type A sorting domain-containing protein [Bacteroidales bacterium]